MTARPGNDLRAVPRPPIVEAWGGGVDSTAMIIELVARGEPPDVVLMAQTESERPETDAFVPIFRRWMDAHGLENHLVCYQVRRFKHWPPYDGLLENLLTNATLPSIAFNRSSCGIKWKITLQDQWTADRAPARAAWERGEKVVRLIGYDCSAADNRRYAHRENHVSDRFNYRYPLREWAWDRDACIARICAEGLPVPVKSSCFFCSAMRPEEVATLPPAYLTVKVKYGDFQLITRSRTFPSLVDTHSALREASLALIRSVLPTPKGIRLVGVTVSNFDRPVPATGTELPLFAEMVA